MYNHNVLYLGANLPLKDLEETVAYYKPNGVLTVLTNNSMAGDAKKLILRIKEKLPHWELLVGGPAILNLNLENVPNIIHLKSMDDLSAQINRTEVTMAA